jgi:hypothetical protein
VGETQPGGIGTAMIVVAVSAAHPVHRIGFERDIRATVWSWPTDRHPGTGERDPPTSAQWETGS